MTAYKRSFMANGAIPLDVQWTRPPDVTTPAAAELTDGTAVRG